jgi:myo-inositol 2-dehydrogenase / D-chiro-inositol 1-dehydrogenase
MTHSTRPLRLGAFGVGRMGRVHVENLARLHRTNRIEFVAIGDRLASTLGAARAYLLQLGYDDLAARLQCSDNPDDMADRCGLDAVVIASRTEHHANDLLSFTRRGIATLVEKPFAESIAEAAAVAAELGERSERLVQVAFQRYYDDAARTAGEWVAQGLIGSLQQTDHVLQDKNPTPESYQSSGITSDMAIHLVFEAMSFRGFELPRRVQALRFLAPPYDDRAGEGANIVHVFCQWESGSFAHLWGSRINATGYDNRFTLIGTEGRIDVGEFAGDFGPIRAKLRRGVGRDATPRGMLIENREFPMTLSASHHPDFHARFAAAFETELCQFVNAVAAGGPFQPGLEIGWKTLLVANVAEASSRQDGRLFELVRPDGGQIASAGDAATFAASAGIE